MLGQYGTRLWVYRGRFGYVSSPHIELRAISLGHRVRYASHREVCGVHGGSRVPTRATHRALGCLLELIKCHVVVTCQLPHIRAGKAAALLHSIARNHALIDGNKPLALAAVIAFYGLNGRRLTLTNDAAYDLVISVAAGHLDTVDAIAAILQTATQPRG